jgi:redox-sensitive bicupin YhaK (pirin superfamily)
VTDDAPLHGDLSVRVRVDPATLEWQASPSGGVARKRFHRVGPAEAGQVTSLVRYAPGSRFPSHPHPDGEEILVLEGVFSDHRGDWPAGSWLASPEGFEHAPASAPGCLLFVKLRQYPGARPRRAFVAEPEASWPAGPDGFRRLALLDDPAFPERIHLEAWTAGQRAARSDPGGLELFVVQGAVRVDGERLPRHGWLRLPPGDPGVLLEAEEASRLWCKVGGVAGLAAA